MNAILQAGGTLAYGQLYVERPADSQLLDALSAGEFCNVLAPRQIGKSSLRTRCQHALSVSRLYRCISLDLSSIGRSELSTEQWYFGFLEQLYSGLDLTISSNEWHNANDLGPVQRWLKFLTRVINEIPDKIVIFIDELDTMLALPAIRDDFFAALRSIYNSRADNPSYERITFCMLGVAAPWELIKDPTRTPFNIGRSIRLGDFTRQDLNVFALVLKPLGGDVEIWLDAIYDWTCGHPYFTQALCMELLEKPWAATDSQKNHVEKCVIERFLQDGAAGESNLNYAEKRLTQSENKSALLSLYRNILRTGSVQANSSDAVQFELQLCGLCTQRRDASGQIFLHVRNRIFSTVFDLNWLRGKEVQRFLSESLTRWQDGGKQLQELLKGTDLEDAQRWAQDNILTREEHEFLMASARWDTEEKRLVLAQEKREQTARQLRLQKRILYGLIAASVIFLLLAGLTYWNYKQAIDAQSKLHKQEEVTKLENAKMEGEITRMKGELQSGNEKIAEKEKELKTQENKLAELQHNIGKADSTLKELNRRMELTNKNTQKDTQVLKDNIESMTHKLESGNLELASLKGENQKLTNKISCYEHYIKNSRQTIYIATIKGACK